MHIALLGALRTRDNPNYIISKPKAWCLRRRIDEAPAFGGEPDVFDVFKTMLGETGKRFNNPLRALWSTGVRAACLLLRLNTPVEPILLLW